MSGATIHYAIIALTQSNVEEVINLLECQRGNGAVIKWLKENKTEVYGDLPEDWKPFKSGNIKEIIENNTEEYHSETHLIEDYFNGMPDAVDLLGIDVFFIDMFSIYLPNYCNFAKSSDLAFCRANQSKCCFLMDYRLPNNVQKELEEIYNATWKFVAVKYREGCLHRLAARVDDLNNFRNYLVSITESKDLPNSKTSAKITRVLQKKDQPLTNFSIVRNHV